MSLAPTGKGRKRWTNRWKAALNAFDMSSWPGSRRWALQTFQSPAR